MIPGRGDEGAVVGLIEQVEGSDGAKVAAKIDRCRGICRSVNKNTAAVTVVVLVDARGSGRWDVGPLGNREGDTGTAVTVVLEAYLTWSSVVGSRLGFGRLHGELFCRGKLN